MITHATEFYKSYTEWALTANDGQPIWTKEDIQRVVSMAACIVDGHLIVGNRHFCPVMQMTIDNLGIRDTMHDHDIMQGFVDQWGIYMSREEAWEVAKAAGQIKEVFVEGVLFSECYL